MKLLIHGENARFGDHGSRVFEPNDGIIYLAGPYGLRVKNVYKMLAAANQLKKCGYLVYVPLLCHYWNALFRDSEANWLEYSLRWTVRCDLLLRLPGESAGADAEWNLMEGKRAWLNG